MTNFYKHFLLISILTFYSNQLFSQSDEIKIKFIGNCGLYMTDGESNFYIDFPYKSGAHNYMEYDETEIDSIKENSFFIFTHRHADHYSKKLLKKLSGLKYDPWNINELEKISESVPNFEIKAFKTEHKVFGISFRHYSYLITWHNKKIYISGDTENSDTIAEQRDIDWAFIPAWLTIDAQGKGIKLGDLSKMFAIYHIGVNDKITNDANNPTIKLLNKQGEIISIPY